ncbi:hypothetical protein HDU86_001552 [Geranomyces michiganensis]|nr:hypothetical protein HDU86_001552 [Geranomyces michiganensis]
MDVAQCAVNLDVQKLVVGNNSAVVQGLIYQSGVAQTLLAGLSKCQDGIAKYQEGIALYQEGIAMCQAGLDELYKLIAQSGGSAIFLGVGWSAAIVGTAASVWRAHNMGSLRAYLLVAVMALTICDCSVVSWARSGDPRVIYGEKRWTYTSMLVVFPILRNSILLVASTLRYQVVLTNMQHRRILVAATVVIAIGGLAAQYALAFTSFAKNDASSASNAFWIALIIHPVTYAVFGIVTFTMTLRKNRQGIVTASANARKMRNLEIINNALGLFIIGACVIVIAMAFTENQQSGYFTTPVQVAACAFWAAGENMFEILASIKTTAGSSAVSSKVRKELSVAKKSEMKLATTAESPI